ncbi:hypothetical protein JLK41_11770 [Ectopseudomonas khazarica]|uniref:hypothetical protein n=1 Tax=Ectopseudomonas khazarica TaxID=2502979 RepID=UPI001AEF9FA2|nr:hypothetical protein [Pseudomonas khazarica]QTS88788.1 hypothetical protein JLK41_11770 [Pseudomonas khazarica]
MSEKADDSDNSQENRLSILAFLALMASLVVFYGDRIVISFYGGGLVFNHSTSMHEYKLSVGDKEFCVAKSYFVFSNSFYPDSGIGLSLAAEADGLEPWNVYLDRIDFYKIRKKISKREVDEIEKRKIGVKIGYLKDGKKSASEQWQNNLSGAQQEQVGRYTRLTSDRPRAAMFKYYLVPSGTNDYSYVIGCNSGARCQLDNYYNASINYEVTFEEELLDSIDDIDSRVRELIDGFVCN